MLRLARSRRPRREKLRPNLAFEFGLALEEE
jgi:hypothetical protein